MNRYESILLDKIVNLYKAKSFTMNADNEREVDERIFLLLDCICDFREPPRALDVADGYGAMVDERGEVIA